MKAAGCPDGGSDVDAVGNVTAEQVDAADVHNRREDYLCMD